MKKKLASTKFEKLKTFRLTFNKSMPAKLLLIPINENTTGKRLLESTLLAIKLIVSIGNNIVNAMINREVSFFIKINTTFGKICILLIVYT